MRKQIKYFEQGRCPFCGRPLINTAREDRYDIELEDGEFVKYFGVRCDNCEVYMSERYVLKFDDIVFGPISDEVSVKNSLGQEVETERNFY